jgi:hypothetical protein
MTANDPTNVFSNLSYEDVRLARDTMRRAYHKSKKLRGFMSDNGLFGPLGRDEIDLWSQVHEMACEARDLSFDAGDRSMDLLGVFIDKSTAGLHE